MRAINPKTDGIAGDRSSEGEVVRSQRYVYVGISDDLFQGVSDRSAAGFAGIVAALSCGSF